MKYHLNMLLSLILSRNLLTGALVDEETAEVVNFHTQSLEYNPSTFEPILSKELLSDFLRNGLESSLYIEDIKICITRTNKEIVLPDLDLNIVLSLERFDLLPQYNLIPIIIDSAFIKQFSSYYEDPIDNYLNYAHYNIPFTYEMVLSLESMVINDSLSSAVNNVEVVVSDLYNKMGEVDMKKYLPSLFKDIASLNPKVRKISIVFDHDFKYASLLAVLKYLNVDIKGYFKDKPMDSDVSIINFDGIKKFTIEKNGEDISEKIVEGKINYIPLHREDELEISSSVIKEKFNNSLGIAIDARNLSKK